jgi:peptide-methionine (S)-S-oxide reductase
MGGCFSSESTKTTNASKPTTPKKVEDKVILREELVLTPEPDRSGENTALQIVTKPKAVEKVEAIGPVERACFGAGCYWGTEKYFRHNFQKKFPNLGNIILGGVGFMGPENARQNPTYREVCNGDTGHVEVYDFEFSGGAAYYEELVKYFFQFHDPTTFNRQGNDRGTQYASVIYCYSDQQVEIATKVKNELQDLLNKKKLVKVYETSIVKTEIRRATKFYPAHEEHQDYLTINPNGYCNHRLRFTEWPSVN